MSVETKSKWTCDYCSKSETFDGCPKSMDLSDWHEGRIAWNTHYGIKVIFCRHCFVSLFPSADSWHDPSEFKKPFWQRFFKSDSH